MYEDEFFLRCICIVTQMDFFPPSEITDLSSLCTFYSLGRIFVPQRDRSDIFGSLWTSRHSMNRRWKSSLFSIGVFIPNILSGSLVQLVNPKSPHSTPLFSCVPARRSCATLGWPRSWNLTVRRVSCSATRCAPPPSASPPATPTTNPGEIISSRALVSFVLSAAAHPETPKASPLPQLFKGKPDQRSLFLHFTCDRSRWGFDSREAVMPRNKLSTSRRYFPRR